MHLRTGKAPGAGPRGTWKRYDTACGIVHGRATTRKYAVTCVACLTAAGINAARAAEDAGVTGYAF